ncbi:MAG TPA: pantetheine-phosphate adenylyltransferase [Sulfurovum sp.]|nr:pantetheine-phosphate adenylyltransferase [Sulfurovum sp.]
MSNVRRAIYPGTFDPVTVGHLDIMKRACSLFDEVVVAVAVSASKNPMFTAEQRIAMLEAATKELTNLKVVGFDNLLVDLSDSLNANVIIRGLRAVSDFEYEIQMGYANSSLKKELETIFLMPSLEYSYVSSSVVRSILPFDGKVDHLLTPAVLKMIKEYKK